ncbi:MAG: flavodoxin family protein [Paracoccaceae bacterium]
MTTIAIVYHSGYGHTAKVAQAVRDGAVGAGAEVAVIEADALGDPGGDDWAPLEAADAIVFGSPTYMGSVSGPFETFADKTSKVWFVQGWKDKIAAGFTVSSALAGDKHGALQRMHVLAMQHGMVWVGAGDLPGTPAHPADDPDNVNRLGYFIGAAAQAGQEAAPEAEPMSSDLAMARALGARVARWAQATAAMRG